MINIPSINASSLLKFGYLLFIGIVTLIVLIAHSLFDANLQKVAQDKKLDTLLERILNYIDLLILDNRLWLLLGVLLGVALSLWLIGSILNQRRWLEGIMEDDKRNLERCLTWLNHSVEVVTYLNEPQPYLLISFWMINSSIFTLQVEKTDGYLHYKGNRLRDEPQLENKSIIKHGCGSGIKIKQVLTPEIAANMRGESPIALDSGHFAIYVIGKDNPENPDPTRKAFHSTIFQIEPINC